MVSFYDGNFEEKGIDYDLWACLDNNPQPYTVEEIEKVLAVYEGENDRENWRWILQLNNDKFVLLDAGCDYTGWDCQSWAKSYYGDTPKEVLDLVLTIVDDRANINDVYSSLERQMNYHKNTTWREQKDIEFGLNKGLNMPDAKFLEIVKDAIDCVTSYVTSTTVNRGETHTSMVFIADRETFDKIINCLDDIESIIYSVQFTRFDKQPGIGNRYTYTVTVQRNESKTE